MKTLVKTLVALTAGVVMTATAQANNNYVSNAYVSSESVNPYYADNHTGQAYVGAKGGVYNGYGSKAVEDADDPVAYGVYAGYHFDKSFGVEAEYMKSNAGDYDMDAYGAYGTYRHYFKNNNLNNLYAKGKLGFTNSEISDGVLEGSDISGGVGLGFQATPNIDIEGEYSRIFDDQDTDVNVDALTIGARLKF